MNIVALFAAVIAVVLFTGDAIKTRSWVSFGLAALSVMFMAQWLIETNANDLIRF